MGWLGKGWLKVESTPGEIDPSILNEYAKKTYVNSKVDPINSDLTTTKDTVKKHGEHIDEINGHVEDIHGRIDDVHKKIDEIETTNETIDATVTKLVDDSTVIENKLNSTVENVTKLTEENTVLKETVNTVETKTNEVVNKVESVETKTNTLENTVNTVVENNTVLTDKVNTVETKYSEVNEKINTVVENNNTILEKVETVVTNPNLLYNSTGIMNLNGYVSTVNTVNYRDRYISDKDSFFYITGPNGPVGFVSQSVPVSGGMTYTFSGYFYTHGNPIDINVGYQTENELNTVNGIEVVNLGKDLLFEDGWTFFEKTFTVSDNSAINGLYLQIVQNGTNTTAECYIKKMKIEEGEKSTSWVAEITDPYQNQIAISGMNAASFLK